MVTFSASVSYGLNSREFSEIEDDFSATDEYIKPSDGQKTSSVESTSEESDNENLTNLRCKSWPPPRRVLQALSQSTQVPLSLKNK